MSRTGIREPHRWEEAKKRLREVLTEAAAKRTTVTYGDVALLVFGGTVPARSRLIMDLLSEVDEEEYSCTGTVIASLVVRADSGIPGDGYFTFIASKLGRDVSDPKRAWSDEAERVWSRYGRRT